MSGDEGIPQYPLPVEEINAIKKLLKATHHPLEIIEGLSKYSEQNTIRHSGGHVVQIRISSVSRRFKELPEEIGNLPYLEMLIITGTQLESLPESIGNLTNLTFLSLERNKLKELPDAIKNFTKLNFLKLESNNFEKLPPYLWKLTDLERLSLKFNPFDEAETQLVLEAITWGTNPYGEITGPGIAYLCRKLFEWYEKSHPNAVDTMQEPSSWVRYNSIFENPSGYYNLLNNQYDDITHEIFARSLYRLGRFDEAETAYQFLVKRNPSTISLDEGFALIAMGRGQWQIAVDYYRSMIDQDPIIFKQWAFKLGFALTKLRNWNDARKYLDMYIDSRPTDSKGYYFKGIFFFEQANYPAAREMFEKALTTYASYDVEWVTPQKIRNWLNKLNPEVPQRDAPMSDLLKYCSKCGIELRSDAKFCNKCGTKC